MTDSTANLTREEAMQLGIRVVPMSYSISGHMFLEGFSGANGEYVSMLGSTAPVTTAQASVIAFMSTFEELLRKGFQVLCIVISSRLSGTYSSASTAAKELDPENIVVVDSLSTSRGMAFLAARARQLADQGYTLRQTALMLEEMRGNLGIAFSVDNMEALRRSGRLGVVRQSMSTILNLRPVLRLSEGAIVAHGLARGRTEQRRMLLSMVPKAATELAVISFGASENGLQLLRQVRGGFPNLPVIHRDGGPVLGIHLGIGTVGLAWNT